MSHRLTRCSFVSRWDGEDDQEDDDDQLTSGAVQWMAPETLSFTHKQVHSTSSDVFSFGQTMYEVLVGRRPYDCLLPQSPRRKIDVTAGTVGAQARQKEAKAAAAAAAAEAASSGQTGYRAIAEFVSVQEGRCRVPAWMPHQVASLSE